MSGTILGRWLFWHVKNMNITILKKLGLSDKEVKVYLALLKNNALSVRAIAEITKINRGTTYDILKSLQEQGLVSYYHQDTKQKFTSEEPDKLLQLLEEKEEELKNTKSKIESLIPELKSLQNKEGNKPVTKFYESKKGVKKILEDVLITLENNDEYYIYSAKNGSDDLYTAYPNFTNDRIKKKIKVKAISLAKGGGISGLDERKWLGTNDESATFIILYKNKCAYISRDANNSPVGVIIENQMIYETQKIIFLKLWALIK